MNSYNGDASKLPKFPLYQSKFLLIPATVIDVISKMNDSDAIIIYMRFFIGREYSLFSTGNKKRVGAYDIAGDMTWDVDRVASALDALVNMELIEMTGNDSEFRIKYDLVDFKVAAESNRFDTIQESGVRKGISIDGDAISFFDLKKIAITLLLDNLPPTVAKSAYGGFAGQMNCLNKILKTEVKARNVELFLKDLKTSIQWTIDRGDPKSHINYFKPGVVHDIIQKIKSKPASRGAVFTLELKSLVEKKVNNCVRSYEMDPTKNPKSEMITKAVDSVMSMIEKRQLNVDRNDILEEVEVAWGRMEQALVKS